jgi:hypothetical protein
LILIETSDDKAPRIEEMGDRSKDSKCVLEYLDTAFYDGLDSDERPDCRKKDGKLSYFVIFKKKLCKYKNSSL